jgi:hypothetical protein
MKKAILFLSLALAVSITAAAAQGVISGFVRTNSGAAIGNVVVSDGFSVVKTNATGAYSFPRNDSTEFVFISVPSAYELPIDINNLPLFYGRVPATPLDYSYDFTLKPFADGGAADINHVLIASGDPQVYNAYETYLFGKESIEDMKQLAASYPEGTHFYGACVGDLVWDVYTLFAGHTENLKQLGFPVFNVIGNHDHDRLIRQDWGSDHYFKENYGPTYYSVNRGKIHYVTLDNIEYTNVTGDKSYRDRIVDYQMRWLEKDLAEVPADMYIVFLVHCPFTSVSNRDMVYTLVNSRRSTHAISGHHHALENWEITSKFYDHTMPAVGGLWNGYLCGDGTPPGYMVFQAGNNGLSSWFFKSTGYDKDYQMRVYPVNSFVNGESMSNKIVANIWNYDSKWSDVSIYENGERHLMYQYNGVDPLTRDFLWDGGDTRPNYGGADVGQPSTHNMGAAGTAHIFYYEPANPAADFEVEVTDRNGITYRTPVLKNLMVASFTKETDNAFYYRQDFDSYRSYPNHTVGSGDTGFGKCTYVQGHSPTGWYSCASGVSLPATVTEWNQFNYIRIDDGTCKDAALYAYGQGKLNLPAEIDADRAMGSLAGSLNRNIHFGVLLENNTGKTLDGIELSYTGEMWRGGLNPTLRQKLAFSYLVNPDIISLRKRTLSIAQVQTVAIDSLSFVSPSSNNAGQNAPCDGNAPDNQAEVSGKIAVTLYPGDVILLRWEDVDDAGNDHALAIDDLTIKAIEREATGSINKTPVSNYSFYNVGRIIYFDEAPMSVVTLYDTIGNVIKKIDVQGKTLDLTPFVSNGIYFLKTKFGTKKLIF